VSIPMSIEPHDLIEYPESDGKPMSESDLHYWETVALREALTGFFEADPRVYIAGNNFFYYEKGNPRAVFSPDIYVVRGIEKKLRPTYKLWEEHEVPCFVMEVSSRSTWLEDVGNKKALCARLGVSEYYLYDPEADVVKPPLQGFLLEDGEYRRIALQPDGRLRSDALGVDLWLDRDLRIHAAEARTRRPLLRPEEARAEVTRTRAECERAEAERKRAEAERKRAEAERDDLAIRVRELEAQLRERGDSR